MINVYANHSFFLSAHTKKNNTNNTKYLLFGEGNVKEKIWDNLEEKNNTNSENSNNSALLASIVSFFLKKNKLALENPSAFTENLKPCSAGSVSSY